MFSLFSFENRQKVRKNALFGDFLRKMVKTRAMVRVFAIFLWKSLKSAKKRTFWRFPQENCKKHVSHKVFYENLTKNGITRNQHKNRGPEIHEISGPRERGAILHFSVF